VERRLTALRQATLLLALLLTAIVGAMPGVAQVRAGAFEDAISQQEIGPARDNVAPDDDPDGPDTVPPQASGLAIVVFPAAATGIDPTRQRPSNVPGAYRARAPPPA